jgi:hypothetical protein
MRIWFISFVLFSPTFVFADSGDLMAMAIMTALAEKGYDVERVEFPSDSMRNQLATASDQVAPLALQTIFPKRFGRETMTHRRVIIFFHDQEPINCDRVSLVSPVPDDPTTAEVKFSGCQL